MSNKENICDCCDQITLDFNAMTSNGEVYQFCKECIDKYEDLSLPERAAQFLKEQTNWLAKRMKRAKQRRKMGISQFPLSNK